MFSDLLEWIETKCAILACMLIYYAGIYWVVVAFWKLISREPLIYAYGANYTQETVPIAVAFFIQGMSLFYQVSNRYLAKRDKLSMVLLMLSPGITACTALVLSLWAMGPPAASASYVPLAGLLVLSAVAGYLVRYGPLSKPLAHSKVAVGSADISSAHSSVARRTTRRRTFADVFGNDSIKTRLLEAGRAVTDKRGKTGADVPRNGILLHGLPGNGKTIFAEALAGELRLPLFTLTHADVASKWVGERTSRVREAFEEAIRHQPCVLLVDEVDSFLESREAGGNGETREDRALVNALLTLMVDIRETRVLLIAATNHLDRLDTAGVREGRFDFKIEIAAPDLKARLGLLKHGLKTHLPKVHAPDELIDSIARRWNGYSTKRLLAVTQELPSYLQREGKKSLEFSDFMGAMRAVQGQGGASLENVRSLADLVLTQRTRIGLSNIAARMAAPEHTERHGGTMPTGVLFFGPPGTGKTAACKALAKELGWTFLPATGGELVRDLERLKRLHVKALELRPALIFIDEADELLRRREMSASTESTNKLLSLLDGAGDRVADVVWIAATNHLDQIDPAMLRGGRFSEKVAFELPDAQALADHLATWLQARRVCLEPGFHQPEFIAMVGHTSIASAEAVAQAALNLAIGQGGTAVQVRRADVEEAIRLVLL